MTAAAAKRSSYPGNRKEVAVVCADDQVHPTAPGLLPPLGDYRNALRLADERGCGPHTYSYRWVRVEPWMLMPS